MPEKHEAEAVLPPGPPGRCWCGSVATTRYSPEYALCSACATLVSTGEPSATRVSSEKADLYGRNYFFEHARALGHPDLVERARLDLSERCVFWLKSLLAHRPPPASTLELGCGNGSFVGLLAAAGYDAAGLDLSPSVTAYARETFGVPVLTGPIEDQRLPPGSLDAVVMMDVLEHLSDPVATLETVASLLRDDGLLLVQTPRFDPARSVEDLQRAGAAFLEQMKPREHLFLLSEGAARAMAARAGFPHVAFGPAIFAHYDMFFVASRSEIPTVPEETWRQSLRRSRSSRIVEALVDAFDAHRAAVGQAAKLGEIEADRAARLEVILSQQRELADLRVRSGELESRVGELRLRIGELEERIGELEHARATVGRRLKAVFRPG